ncbi:TlpA disulfide reductase family protein [Microbacterium xylanilyticum]
MKKLPQRVLSRGTHTRRPRLVVSILTVGLSALLVLTGCTTSRPSGLEPLQRSGTTGYASGDDTIVEVPAAKRDAPVTFAGPLERGGNADSTTWLGSVVVVNFWYAACGPCRAEAPDLQALNERFSPEGVVFVGVNVRDSSGTAMSFEKEFGVTYASILDVNSGAVQYAFSGKAAPNAVPTTLVLDRTGRMASRILGQLPSRGTLAALIQSALSEGATK